VLGLMSWLFLSAQVTLYGAEVNVVRARRLWPRSILQPPLTEADRRALTDLAKQEERRPEQAINVQFTPQANDPAPTVTRASSPASAATRPAQEGAQPGGSRAGHQLAQIILTERVAVSCRGSPTRSKGESGTVMLCWSLMVELAAWAGCGQQAGANRQATREAGHRDGY
jgi:hypothetical protein